MHQGICRNCGASFWESYKGARGQDVCDTCEDNDRRAAAHHAAGLAAALRGEPISNAPFGSDKRIGRAWRKGWLSAQRTLPPCPPESEGA